MDTIHIVYLVIAIIFLILVVFLSGYIGRVLNIPVVAVFLIGIFLPPIWIGLLVATLIVKNRTSSPKSTRKSSPRKKS